MREIGQSLCEAKARVQQIIGVPVLVKINSGRGKSALYHGKVIAIFPSGAIQTIGMSACLAGSVCGDHCSPISDTTIMSSAGGQCNHLNHVSTQLPYAISVAAISFVMYIVSGFVQKAYIVLPIGAVLTLAFLFVMKMAMVKKYGKENV